MSNTSCSLMLPRVAGIFFALIMTGCASVPTPTLQSDVSSLVPPIATTTPPKALSTAQAAPTVTATDIYAFHDNFGDGFIARLPINENNTLPKEEIVKILVTQWLDHYKLQSNDPQAAIEDYKVDSVTIMGTTGFYNIVAGVRFSIIPSQTPNEWGSFPGDEIKPDDRWWHLWAPFGVFRDGDYLRLRLLSGWGT